jgi:hypothetical protein
MALFGSWSLPPMVELVSVFLGVHQAFGDRDRVALAETFAFELDAMCAVNDAVQDRVAQSGIPDDVVPATNRDLAFYSGAILSGSRSSMISSRSRRCSVFRGSRRPHRRDHDPPE